MSGVQKAGGNLPHRQSVLADLARAKAVFQLRAVVAAMGRDPNTLDFRAHAHATEGAAGCLTPFKSGSANPVSVIPHGEVI